MRPKSATAAPPLGTTSIFQAWSGVLTGSVLIVVALALLREYTTYSGDDPLVGVVLLVAAVLAVPGVAGVALGSCALALRYRRPGVARTLASAAFVVTVVVVVGCVLRVLG